MSAATAPEEAWSDLGPSAILVLDDDADVRSVIRLCLEADGYAVVTAGTLAEARELLASRDILLVLSDVTLRDGESGLDLLAELAQRRPLQAHLPRVDVIVMTAHSDVHSAIHALKHGAYDYLHKPFEREVLSAAIKRAVDSRRLAARMALHEQLESRRHADQEHLEQFLQSMANVIDAKSRFTAQHSRRVSALARLLGEALGFDGPRCDLLALGGRLHDLGKIGTPDAILDKPTSLSAEEFQVIREHPKLGDQLLSSIRSLERLRPMVRWHHERLDGRGYPDGLRGDAIPEDALVIKTADIWEAVTSHRPYRAPMSMDLAVRCLRSEIGPSLPREMVETFLAALQDSPLALSMADGQADAPRAAPAATRAAPHASPAPPFAEGAGGLAAGA